MMQYVILAAGEFPKRGETLDILTGGDILICCDGAVEDALRYRVPDFIVGDMDSISPQNKERFREIIHSESVEEVLFAVEKDWLVTYLNRTTNEYWTADKVKKWLKTEYTSEESSTIFKVAIQQKAVIMLEFN